MDWGIEDFAAAAAILIALGVGVAVVGHTVSAQPTRVILIAGVILGGMAVWAHLAVGTLRSQLGERTRLMLGWPFEP